MAKKIKVGFYKAGSLHVDYVEIEDKLDEYYRLLESDVFDIARRRIGGTVYDIFCDDMGLLRSEITLSAVSLSDRYNILVGNLIFTHSDVNGNTTGISEEECNDLNTRFTNELGYPSPFLAMD